MARGLTLTILLTLSDDFVYIVKLRKTSRNDRTHQPSHIVSSARGRMAAQDTDPALASGAGVRLSRHTGPRRSAEAMEQPYVLGMIRVGHYYSVRWKK